MKKIKVYLTIIVTIILLAIASQVYAYGSQVDTTNIITMPSSLTNGTGNVSATISGDINYQFVEITSQKYAIIKKYEAIYTLIKAYMNGDSNYDTLATNYENTYNQTANGIMSEYGIQFNEEGYNAIRGLWITELTTYNASSWTKADGTTISLDLTTFEGTKYYIAWVKIGDTYDAEAYKLTGTKQENNNENDNNNDNVKDEDKNENTNNENNKNETVENGNTNNTDKNPTIGKDNTTSTKTELPKTGVRSSILGLITIFTTTAGISFAKYRKIK